MLTKIEIPKKIIEEGLALGLSSYQLASKTRCSASTIIRYAKQHGLSFPKNRRVISFCRNCETELKRGTSSYCSHKCQHDYQWKERKKVIEENGYFDTTSHMSSAKRYILEKQGHNCKICGGKDWLGKPIPLELDHINGDSTDQEIENFRLVCGNCAMQLPTYKARNKGKGRHARRERYKEGKSY